jgi:preprotein translocase subunit SecF
MSVPADPVSRPSLWHRLFHGETTFDFVGKRRVGYLASAVVVVISVVALAWQGLNLSLDFVGGTSWETPAAELSESDVRGILDDQGVNGDDAKVQRLSGVEGDRWRIQSDTQPPPVIADVQTALAEAAGVAEGEVSVAAVSASWGEEITRSAVQALIVFFLAIAVYISFRFEWRMAIAAISAVFHDVVVTVGFYAVTRVEVTPATVIAFLTILGFSLYDTIVVFDKVHENTKRLAGAKVTYGDIINLSMNQVLMRSINTSIAAVLPVLSLLVVGSWFLGAVSLQDFALALVVGLLAGTYSSIFVATPLLWELKHREERWRRADVRAGEIVTGVSVPSAAARMTSVAAAAAAAPELEPVTVDQAPSSGPVTVPAPTSGLGHPPRPRKKTRR